MDNSITILIIDDDFLMQKIVEASLLKDGYNLIFAQNGEDGIIIAQEKTPDLILLDVMMPGMDGFEVCSRLRNDAQLLYIPIIIITALDDRDSRIQGLEAGADDYICKPFDKIEFRARVKTVTRLNRYSRWKKIFNLQEQLEEKNTIIEAQSREIEQLRLELNAKKAK